jgi:hypothetical protein
VQTFCRGHLECWQVLNFMPEGAPCVYTFQYAGL